MYWPVVAILVSSMLVACGPDKGGGETGSSSSSGSSGMVVGTGSSSDSGGVVTTGGGCPLETGECGCDGPGDQGCIPDPICVDGQWTCDCSMCHVDTSTGTGTTGTSSSGTGSTGEGGTTGETTGGETTGGGVVCGGDMPAFPEFDRTCLNDGDCSLVFHQVDCCGSLVAWGLSNDAAKAFAEAEAVCEAMYPDCDCAMQPTQLDDGSSTEIIEKIAVTCQAGSCFSFQV